MDCRYCAVALVISEMVNDEVTVDVDGSSYTRLYDKQARQRCVGKLLISGDLEAWTEKYDRGKSVPTGEIVYLPPRGRGRWRLLVGGDRYSDTAHRHVTMPKRGRGAATRP